MMTKAWKPQASIPPGWGRVLLLEPGKPLTGRSCLPLRPQPPVASAAQTLLGPPIWGFSPVWSLCPHCCSSFEIRIPQSPTQWPPPLKGILDPFTQGNTSPWSVDECLLLIPSFQEPVCQLWVPRPPSPWDLCLPQPFCRSESPTWDCSLCPGLSSLIFHTSWLFVAGALEQGPVPPERWRTSQTWQTETSYP